MLRDEGLAEELATDRELLRRAGVAVTMGAGAYEPAMFPATERAKQELRGRTFSVSTSALHRASDRVIAVELTASDAELLHDLIANTIYDETHGERERLGWTPALFSIQDRFASALGRAINS